MFAFGDLNNPTSRISLFNARHKGELKPEENTRPSVQYRGLGSVAPRVIKNKLPKGRNHDPFTYKIDTWAELKSDYGTPASKLTGDA